MGTSQSKRDARPASPLIPPWADGDPPPPMVPPPGGPLPPVPVAPPAPPPEPAPPRRYGAFRRALGDFARSGDAADARRALGHWASTSTGGAGTGARRLSRAVLSGSAALAAVGGAGRPPTGDTEKTLDVRSLRGLSTDAAIARIVEAFCPPGILDEDAARIAVGEALAIALAGADVFDPDAVNADVLRRATLAFVAELVFLEVAGDGGDALAAAPTPAVAMQREADLRGLIREVCDQVGTPILEAAGDVLTAGEISRMVTRLIREVQTEMQP